MKNHFASVIGKSEVWNFVRSLRKSLGKLTFNRPPIVALFARLWSKKAPEHSIAGIILLLCPFSREPSEKWAARWAVRRCTRPGENHKVGCVDELNEGEEQCSALAALGTAGGDSAVQQITQGRGGEALTRVVR